LVSDIWDRPAVRQCRHARAHVGYSRAIDLDEAETRLITQIEQHFAPRIDDEAMAKRIPSVLVMTHLCGGNNE
jgi:hypothetical protein